MKFSIIIPVYNRPDEIRDLLESLARQDAKNFEVVIVEDGSTVSCHPQVDEYGKQLDIKYFDKENEGRSIARNYGLERAEGDYFVFFDSDCVIPPTYFSTLEKLLAEKYSDCYGGPDAAHESFSDTQKAINYSMTSFMTTGGIRGGKVKLEKFVPRTFNMGFSREVYNAVGGFREMFSEDIDMSTRISRKNFTTTLFREVPVWHKRRVDFKKFFRQVHVFGMSRITLAQLYPGSLKAVHLLPAMFVLGCLAFIVLGCSISPWFFLGPVIYALMVLIGALIATRRPKVAFLAVPAAFIQLFGYGSGFLRAVFTNYILGRGRNIQQEIEIRRGNKN